MYEELIKELREADEVSMCGECGYRGDKKGPLFAKAADAIEELSKLRWIPVTKRLPKMRDAGILKKLGINLRSAKCLIVISDGKDQIVDNDAELRDGKWHSDTLRWLSVGKKTFEVTHWMPLPEPPKEETR